MKEITPIKISKINDKGEIKTIDYSIMDFIKKANSTIFDDDPRNRMWEYFQRENLEEVILWVSGENKALPPNQRGARIIGIDSKRSLEEEEIEKEVFIYEYGYRLKGDQEIVLKAHSRYINYFDGFNPLAHLEESKYILEFDREKQIRVVNNLKSKKYCKEGIPIKAIGKICEISQKIYGLDEKDQESVKVKLVKNLD